MYNVSDILLNILIKKKKIEIKELPSQGLFYPDDFEIKIKKAEVVDIIEYEHGFEDQNIGLLIKRIKRVVKKNITLSNDYAFDDIKSCDVVFLFLEIVKYTCDKKILIKLKDNESVEVSSSTFSYFNFKPFEEYYDCRTREFILSGFRYSPPSVGVEGTLTNFLLKRGKEYEEYTYEFIFFTGHKRELKDSDIDNLIQIFNFDITDKDRETILDISSKFINLSRYLLKYKDSIIEMPTLLNFKNIWN